MTPLADPRSVLAALRRHKLLFAVAFLATLAPIVAWTFKLTPLYEAAAVVMVQLGREYSQQVTVGDRQAVLNRDPQAALNTELQILLSRDLTEAVVERLGAETLYPDLAEQPISDEEKSLAAAGELGGAFTARLLPDSSVIQIALRHPNRLTAERALTVLFEEFRQKHLDTFGDPQLLGFLDQKVADHRARLDASEDRIQRFLQENEPLDLQNNPGDAHGAERARLEAELNQHESRVAGLRHQLLFLAEERTRAPDKPEADAIAQQSDMIRNARLKLLDLQVEEERLLGTYSETSRPVAAIREQIKIVQDFLTKQEAAVGGGRLLETVAAEQTRLNSELQFELARGWEIKQQLASLDEELTALPERTRRYRDLVRERDLSEKYLNAYLSEQEEAQLTADLDREKIAKISLIQKVRVGSNPVSPNKRLNVAVGAVLALIVGSVAAIGAELLRGGRDVELEAAEASGAAPAAEEGAARERGVATPFTAHFEGPPGPRKL
ncbi:MAG: GumC family protein [Thermoanaerobaculia bacterium]